MSISLLQLFPAQAVQHIGGAEYATACPYCGGKDRFRLWIDRGPRERTFWCRQCKASGDAIELVRHLEQCSYRDACRLLDIDPGTPKTSKSVSSSPSSSRPASSGSSSAKAPRKDTVTMPSRKWIEAATSWLGVCQRHLRERREAWQALADRYLSVESALAAGIGWNPRTEYVPRSAWGLPPGPDGKDKIILPQGLVLSVRRAVGVVGLTVRLCGDGDGPRYRDIAGSTALPFGIGKSGQPVMIVESILDAVLIWQEAQGELASIAVSGVSKPFDEAALEFIRQAPRIYLCPDRDEAGAGAYAEWSELFPQGKLLLVPEGADVKDPTEMQDKAFTHLDSSVPTVSSWLHRHVLAHNPSQSKEGISCNS